MSWCDADGNCSVIVMIRLPDQVKSPLKDSWPKDDYDKAHITMLYLGKRSPADIENAVRALRSFKWKPMLLTIQGWGAFTSGESNVAYFSPKAARSTFSGVDREPGLQDLHYALLHHFTKHGFEVSREHDFVPHITFGYFDKSDVIPDLTAKVGKIPGFRVGELELVVADHIRAKLVL